MINDLSFAISTYQGIRQQDKWHTWEIGKPVIKK